jgi:hypothetical protein
MQLYENLIYKSFSPILMGWMNILEDETISLLPNVLSCQGEYVKKGSLNFPLLQSL